ncbi:MAG: pitrilysin family protein [Pseudomonadota bacterium]
MIRVALAAFTAALIALPVRAAVEIEEITTPGGFTAWLVQEDSIPFTALELRFAGGTSLDLPGKRGAMNMMTLLLDDGSGDMEAQAFVEAREALAARFSFEAYDDGLAISAQFLTEFRDESLALLRQAITEPRFDEAAMQRTRAQVIAGIRSEETDPDEIARRTFDALAFGDHPYGSPSDGTVESVAALTREDMVEAHARVFAKDRVHISAVGDVSADELATILDELLGGLPETGAPELAVAEFQLEPGLTVVPFETPQSVAYFGHEGIARDDPDFFPAFVANEIFSGAGFESRLMQEVRVKRGLTYGIGASLVPKELGALILGRVGTVNARMAETIEVVRDEWVRIAEEGVTQQELDSAITYLTGAYPLRFDGNRRIAEIMVGMQVQDLPIDYIATRNDQVRAVTLEDIRRVAARIYRPDDLHIVVVGQPEGLEASN